MIILALGSQPQNTHILSLHSWLPGDEGESYRLQSARHVARENKHVHTPGAGKGGGGPGTVE